MLIDQTLAAFTDELASNSPAPGGGSIAALAGTLGAALTSMVCRLTVGKKKFADVEAELQNVLAHCETLRAQLGALIDEDTEAFTHVMRAFALPKDSDAEKQSRFDAIEHAMKGAVRVPLEVMRLCAELAPLVSIVAEKGNPNSVTDAGVAALMIEAATTGAAYNVGINLGSINDREFSADVSSAMTQYQTSVASVARDIAARVTTKLQPASTFSS